MKRIAIALLVLLSFFTTQFVLAQGSDFPDIRFE